MRHPASREGRASCGLSCRWLGSVSYGALLMLGLLLGLDQRGAARADEEDDENPYRPGLVALYTDQRGREVSRVDSAPTFSGSLSEIDPRLAAGGHRIQWQGRLWVQQPGPHRLAVFASGRTRITLNNSQVIETSSARPSWSISGPLVLDFDRHALTIEHASEEAGSRLAVYWTGPQFTLEPIPARFLVHDRDSTPVMLAQRGADLVRALRCEACHSTALQQSVAPLRAPSLERLSGRLHRSWFVAHLAAAGVAHDPRDAATADASVRRMPHFALESAQIDDLAAYLAIDVPAPSPTTHAQGPAFSPPSPSPTKSPASNQRPANPTKGKAPTPEQPSSERGLTLIRSVGCLACHRHQGLGTSDLFDGGDLTHLAAKRPRGFVERWLADPAAVQRAHRMPLMELSPLERNSIALALEAIPASSPAKPAANSVPLGGDVERGKQLFTSRGCVTCHAGPGLDVDRRRAAPVLSQASRWDASCLQEPNKEGNRPGYRLVEADQRAIRELFRGVNSPLAANVARLQPTPAGHNLLRENHCLACHARNDQSGLSSVAAEVVRHSPELAPLLPALSPPPLTHVGDKLHDSALEAAIRRSGASRRPWLAVRMPRFPWQDSEVSAVVAHLVDQDRVPAGAPAEARASHIANRETLGLSELSIRTTGGRLVTPDGFGCTSCHAVGSVQPPPAPLNARGPDLSQVGQRIRGEWFDRWVRNPARIVPRMEMPSVQIAVRGTLNEQLDAQLAAVWHALNLPDFVPPEPNPVQTLRLSGLPERRDRAELLTDVVQADGRVWLKPLLIGLGNRQNILFDLEQLRIARWSIGDTARQRTKGKSWHWEAAGVDLLKSHATSLEEGAEFLLEVQGERQVPLADGARSGQFPTEIDQWRHIAGSLEFTHRLRFPGDSSNPGIRVTQTFAPLSFDSLTQPGGFRRSVQVSGLAPGSRLRFRAVHASRAREATVVDAGRKLRLDEGVATVEWATPGIVWDADGSALTPVADSTKPLSLELVYRTTLANDQFHPVAPPKDATPTTPLKPTRLPIAPGFTTHRLPLDEHPMPTALAWRPSGELIVASLKGRVLLARDSDGDELEDQWQVFSDELAAPYGVAAAGDAIDVAAKYAVLRLWDDDRDGRADRAMTVASGWGHTTDYHDWTVGLVPDGAGGYFSGLACQQDKRSPAAAKLRGAVIHLTPPAGGVGEDRPFQVETVTAGHRFPMGLARNRQGDLFVTDNQGNYNPFNELNHVRPGLRYGFINSLEQRPDFRPPAEPPAIAIPHPWTRSVNGICLLDAPNASGKSTPAFGPFTGHFVGCEYDTRRLVRMSLQKAGETFQGAVYPLTYDEPRGDEWLLGPITCAVSPRGDLYVGGIRDSGWGGGNNLGELVRLRFDPQQLPAGIAEVRSHGDGFEIDFTQPITQPLAAETSHYAVSSYRRESTPAYGGPDLERRDERVTRATLADDGRTVRLELASPAREGYVYEFRLRGMTAAGVEFHPAEAYFTLRQRVSR